jgi:hypothetical protein
MLFLPLGLGRHWCNLHPSSQLPSSTTVITSVLPTQPGPQVTQVSPTALLGVPEDGDRTLLPSLRAFHAPLQI